MAEPEQDEGVAVADRAVALLRDGGEIDLVLHQDRYTRACAQRADQPYVPGRGPVGAGESPGGGVDQAGRADGDGVRRGRARRGERLVHGGECGGDGRVGGTVRADGDGVLGAHPAQEVGDRDGDAVRPQIEADEVGPVGDDPVEPGIGPAPLGAGLTDHGDQPGLLETFDEVRHRRPGQPGQRLELTCRQMPLGLE